MAMTNAERAEWQTWQVCLWFDNDLGLYEAKIAKCKRMKVKRMRWTGARAARFARAEMGDRTPDGAGLSRVRWSEVAEAWNSDLDDAA